MERVETDEGFFKGYHRKLENTLTESNKEEFEELKSNEDRFNFVLNMQKKCSIPISKTGSNKDHELATKFKSLGNKAFQEQKYNDACKLYTESALKIPWQAGSSSELAIIIANRSAALYHLQEYDLSLIDIELCLSLDYPSELRYKILDRKARCLLAKKHLKDALYAFRETLTALDAGNLNSDRKKKFQLDVQIMLGMLGKNPNLTNVLPPPHSQITPVISGGISANKSASTAVRISQSPSMGRFAVAARNINVNDTLIFEPAYCSVLLAEYSKTHCFHCFKRTKNPLPCPTCSNVVFCQVICQQNALRSHHKFECNVLPSLWASGASITCLMALRILSQSSLEYFLSVRPQLGQVPQSHQKEDYLNVYNLVTHEIKRTPDDLFHRAHMATFLYKCLKVSGYFGDVPETDENPTLNESFVGGLLLHHLQLLQFNAHEISELVLDKDEDIETGLSIFLGGGLYPTLALFNHSCAPSITRYFMGTSVVVKAIKNIQYGEMIAENYGPIFTQTSKNERQRILKTQYWFTCSCIPCEEDWPLFNEMDPNIMRFKCTGECKNGVSVIPVSINTMDFMVQCSVCKQYTNILKGLKSLQDTDTLFMRAKSYIRKKDVEKALLTFCELFNRLDDTLAPPFKDYLLCQQGIRRCLLYFGNRYQKC